MPDKVSSPTVSERMSTAAIVTYASLGLLAAVLLGVFLVIFFGVKVDGVMLGVLGGLISAVVGLATTAVGFWVGSSVGGRDANARLGQLAGAGAPPPIDPVSGEPPAAIPPSAGSGAEP